MVDLADLLVEGDGVEVDYASVVLHCCDKVSSRNAANHRINRMRQNLSFGLLERFGGRHEVKILARGQEGVVQLHAAIELVVTEADKVAECDEIVRIVTEYLLRTGPVGNFGPPVASQPVIDQH